MQKAPSYGSSGTAHEVSLQQKTNVHRVFQDVTELACMQIGTKINERGSEVCLKQILFFKCIYWSRNQVKTRKKNTNPTILPLPVTFVPC